MPHTLDATTVRAWCALALEALGQAREGIDAINVYPVADGDTGTNLYLTVESAARAVDAVFAAHAAVADQCGPALPDAVRAMAHGALIGAQGNSGTIVAQLLRGMAEVLSATPGDPAAVPASPVPEAASPRAAQGGDAASPGTDGSAALADLLARALRRAAESAYQAVAHPVEGTVLTVAMAAAEAAETAAGAAGGAESAEGAAAMVVRAAYEGARVALDATPGQLAVLGRAGVVDAGGCGLVALLGALVEAVSGASPKEPVTSLASSFPAGSGTAGSGRPARPASGAESTATAAASRPWTSRATRPDGRVPAPEALPAPRSAASPRSAAGEQGDGAGEQGDGAGAPSSYGPWISHDPRGQGTAADGEGGRTPAAPAASAFPGEDGAAVADCEGAAVSGPEPCGDICQEPAYEVTYLLEADDQAVAVLRERLDALGDSLVVVGGEGLWNVHVHVDDAGAAVEAGIRAGRPYRIRITHFGGAVLARTAQSAGGDASAAPYADGRHATRAVVAVVPGEGLAAIYREAGAHVVTACPGEPPASGELVEAIRRAQALEVVLLPNDAVLRHTAAAAAEQVRAEGVRAALIPTRSSVQGIAALAVHEPGRRFDEDVVAMTSAAGATRYAELAVAERQSWTTAGVCEAGDILGLIDGDVAVIGADLAETAVTVLDRMLAAGGEMVTLVLGSGIPEDLGERLERHVREGHLAVDTVLYWGGQPSVPLLIGVE